MKQTPQELNSKIKISEETNVKLFSQKRASTSEFDDNISHDIRPMYTDPQGFDFLEGQSVHSSMQENKHFLHFVKRAVYDWH